MTNEKNIPSVELVNLTPHDVVLLSQTGDKIVIPRSGTVLRLPETTTSNVVVSVGGREVSVVSKKLETTDANALPKQEGRLYIVSLPVAQVVRREDFVVPDDLVRDDKGQVVGAKRLARIVGD
jgi:hypothetical protein